MSMYKGAKTLFYVDSKLSEVFEVKLWTHRGSELSYLFFAVVVDVVTDIDKRGCVI